MLLINPLHKEYRQLITQLTVSGHLLFFTVLLTGSTPRCVSLLFHVNKVIMTENIYLLHELIEKSCIFIL